MLRFFACCLSLTLIALFSEVATAQNVGNGAPVAQTGQLPAQLGQPAQLGPPAGVNAQPGLVAPPFQLTPVEQQFVDQILDMWENSSSKIKTFDCRFERWEYDPVFGPGNNIPMIKSQGQLTYSKPDKGSFKIEEIFRYKPSDPQAQPQPDDWVLQKHEVGEHWVCDGSAIFEYKHDKKQLVVQPLPPEMRGKAIVDGPLPFLFGAEAKKLKNRYWIRSLEGTATTIRLEAFPRFQNDRASYQRVEVILDRKTMHPSAIQVYMPNGQSRAVYMFIEPTINGKLNQLFGSIFSSPRTPLGWKRVVNQPPPGPAPQAANPQGTAKR